MFSILVNYSVIVNTVFLFCYIVEPILLSSSSAEAVIQQLKNPLQLDQGFFKNPTTGNKRAIRVLARKAKNLKRFDVFKYLREITPPGTTGLLFNIISLNPSQYFSINFWAIITMMPCEQNNQKAFNIEFFLIREIQIGNNLRKTRNSFKFARHVWILLMS